MLFQQVQAIPDPSIVTADKLASQAFSQAISVLENAISHLAIRGEILVKEGEVSVFKDVTGKLRLGYSVEVGTRDEDQIRELREEVAKLRFALHAVQSWKEEK